MLVFSPLTAVAQSDQLMDLYNEYKMHLEAGNYPLAKTYAEGTFELAKSELGYDKALIADRTVDLAAVEALLGDLNSAIRHYRNAIDLYEEALGIDNERIVRPLQALADVQAQVLNVSDADASYLRAISLLQRHVGLNHVNTAIALWHYAEFLALQYETAEDALAVIARAEYILQRMDDVPPLARMQLYAAKGSIQSKVGLDQDALASFELAESIASQDGVDVDAAMLTDLYLNLAQANGKLGRNAVARTYFFKARPGEPAAILVYRPKPEMPSTTVPELRYNMRGQALVEFTITREGNARGIQVISSTPDSSFGVAARRNVTRWEYLPPMNEQGRSVEILAVQELVQFYLADPAGPRMTESLDR